MGIFITNPSYINEKECELLLHYNATVKSIDARDVEEGQERGITSEMTGRRDH